MRKSEEVKQHLDGFALTHFGRTLTEAHEQQVCVKCGSDAKPDTFRDALSVKEYGISALCQSCQDEVFG